MDQHLAGEEIGQDRCSVEPAPREHPEIRAIEVTGSRIGDVRPVQRHRFGRTGDTSCLTWRTRSRTT
ncbi:MAG: hypothetical protein B7Z04_08140 [Rhodobacterales bacterium 32-66-9]|nr:MAG: hypothetical protein B7Z04_08140 [Rhodobacterales bacterium 32-66-9]